MMPPQFHGQQPAPFPQIRHHEPSASPPVPNGAQLPQHGGHPSRTHTPQPGPGSRPGSRNDVRRVANMAPPPVNPHGGMAYMQNPQMYNAPPPQQQQPGVVQHQGGPQYYPQQPHGQPHPQQFVDDRRQQAPPGFPMQPQHGMPVPPRPDQPPMHAQPGPPQQLPQTRISPPPPPPRPHEMQAPAESDRPQPLLLNTDAAIRKFRQKGHSIFTPIEAGDSVLSQHLASFAEPSQLTKGESSARSQSLDGSNNSKSGSSPPFQRSQSITEKGRNSAAPSSSEPLFAPPPRHNSIPSAGGAAGARPRGPRLTVQIPDGASEAGGSAGGSNSPRNPAITPTQAPRSAVLLPPPSPSASALLSAGATGPPNPFARPLPQQPVNETPVSALPSRFLSNDFLPSPSSFYPDWNLRGGDNAPASPLNFATPVVSSGPSFLRDDPYHPPPSMKRKSDTGPNSSMPEIQAEPKRTKVE